MSVASFFSASQVSEEEEQQRAAEVQVAHVDHEIEVRAANTDLTLARCPRLSTPAIITPAGPRGREPLKEFLILNDFSSVNDSSWLVHAAHR